jgi:hypothetical protein
MLRGGDHIRVEKNADLAPQHIEQNQDTVAVCNSSKEPGAVHERSGQHAHLVSMSEDGLLSMPMNPP